MTSLHDLPGLCCSCTHKPLDAYTPCGWLLVDFEQAGIIKYDYIQQIAQAH